MIMIVSGLNGRKIVAYESTMDRIDSSYIHDVDYRNTFVGEKADTKSTNHLKFIYHHHLGYHHLPNWFSSSNIVRCTSLSPDCSPPYRLVPMASISSIKIIAPLRPMEVIVGNDNEDDGGGDVVDCKTRVMNMMSSLSYHPRITISSSLSSS